MDNKAVVLGMLTNMPMKSKDIATLTGLKDTEVREAVHDLRMEGEKICSGSEGFWIWGGKDDSWSHTKAHIRSRAKKLWTLYEAMDADVPGQIEMIV